METDDVLRWSTCDKETIRVHGRNKIHIFKTKSERINKKAGGNDKGPVNCRE